MVSDNTCADNFGDDTGEQIMTLEELDEAVFELETHRLCTIAETERLGKQIVNANNRIDELMTVLLMILEGPDYPVILDETTCGELRRVLCHTHRIDNENPEDFQSL
jgi:SpoU rRNA methylase family enzyme